MIMARKDCLETLRKALIEGYYAPKDLDPEIISCITAEGAGLAQV